MMLIGDSHKTIIRWDSGEHRWARWYWTMRLGTRGKASSMHEQIVPRFSEREIWWCSVGVNVGHEADSKHEQNGNGSV